MPLTPQEENFCDHLDYENTHIPADPGMPVPACNWMTAHRLSQRRIWNILMLRRWERKDPMLPEEPPKPYAPAWNTAEEAERRNQKLEKEANDARPAGSPPLGEAWKHISDSDSDSNC